MEPLKIAVLGAGSAGLFSAWYLSRLSSGAEIHIFDQHGPGMGATRAAAGMLAPMNELEFQELDLLHAGRKSLALYHHEVVPALGDIGLLTQGTLEVGLHADDVAYLRRLFEFQQKQGLPVEWLSGEAVQAAEPLLAHSVQNAILAKQDVQVDNLKLVPALVHALTGMGVQFHAPLAVKAIRSVGEQVRLEWEGGMALFDKVLVCVGAMAPEGFQLPYKVYPVRGEMIALRPLAGATPHMTVRVRSQVHGNAYVVPKEGRVLCGSTSEEKGRQTVNTAGGLLDILRKCHAVLPCLYEMELIETWAALRPASLSRQPLLDQEPGTAIYHLNGLFRHGILLGPLMGKAAATLMLTGKRLHEVEQFRFPEF